MLTLQEAVADHVRTVLDAESAALEVQCESALRLTPSDYWHRLQVVEVVDITRPPVPRAVACAVSA